jgi:signal transduction histidine kinase
MLRDDELPAAVVGRAVERLQEALERLEERTLDVQLLASASMGRLRLAPRRVTVGRLAAGLPGSPDVHGGGPDVELDVDPELFPRILRDLWEAGSAAPAPRSLRLVVVTTLPWIELRVERDADPIDPEVLQALFEPFDLNDDASGITIGLYLARALAVAHGGTIGVDQDDEGASLWVRLPAVPVMPTPDRPAHAPEEKHDVQARLR